MIERQEFGSTGHASSRVLFGAAALGNMRQERSDQVLQTVLDAGINHIDTARSYGDSELRLQSFLSDHRSSFFLASKTGARTASEARRELEESLHRMGVEQIDLIQLHNLVEDDEWAMAHGPGGAVEALTQAHEEGLVRFIGVTGHGTRIPSMHLRSLRAFAFDSVLFPYNFTMMSSDRYRADVEVLLAECNRRSIAVQTIKSIARRRWSEGSSEAQFSWYQPLPEGDALTRGVAYVLSRPQLFLNTSSDARLLPTIIRAAERASVRTKRRATHPGRRRL